MVEGEALIESVDMLSRSSCNPSKVEGYDQKEIEESFNETLDCLINFLKSYSRHWNIFPSFEHHFPTGVVPLEEL